MTCINWSAVSESAAGGCALRLGRCHRGRPGSTRQSAMKWARAAGKLAATAAPMRRIVRVTLRVTVATPRRFPR